MQCEENLLAWRIDPLPDFLLDHTLTEEQGPARLREVVSRWVQFVGALWRWHDRASFAIRFTSDTDEVRAFFLAVPLHSEDLPHLRSDLDIRLRSHGLPVLRQGAEAESQPDSPLWNLGGDVEIAEVRQHLNERLWTIPKRSLNNSQVRKDFEWLPEAVWEETPILFPWWAPGGPFLIPVEKLISQTVPASLTTYITPTSLSRREWDWLAFVSKTAQSLGDFQAQAIDQAMSERRVDPAATLAGRLAMANLRRLSDKAFLVSVQCAAGFGASSAVRAVAGTVQSIVYEPPFDRSWQEDDRLPSAADVRVATPGGDYEASDAIQQYQTLRLSPPVSGDQLWRIPYLADARGVATVFRLPINVRGGVPGFRVAQRPPDFHPGPRRRELQEDHILIGELHQGGIASLHKGQFTKHALITGFTGSGKTVTVQSIVHQLHRSGVPVLVLESAKHEYRSLLGASDFRTGNRPLWIFTAGNEACSPLRFNPFEVLPGTRVETHIGRLQTCFEAALPPIGPLASMIGEALVDVYERLGWCLTDVGTDVGAPVYLRFPSMLDFFDRMSALVNERGYEGEVRSNVSAAVLGRIKPLTVGTKGRLLQADQPTELGRPRARSLLTEIFGRSTIIELNDLNLEDKALVTMFLLMFLREHRESQPSKSGGLTHATVVEEAHNVLENVESTGVAEGGAADTRFKAVQAFCSLLTEIRALGESLIIVDQSPEKLAPDALRNTNIQIAHQLRDSRDRESIARAMLMESEQKNYLGKLVPGQAALFVTGLERATYVKVPLYSGVDPREALDGSAVNKEQRLEFPSDADVKGHMSEVTSRYRSGPFGRPCESCDVRLTCDHRAAMLRVLADGQLVDRFSRVADAYRKDRSVCRTQTVKDLVSISAEASAQATGEVSKSSTWCGFVHLWHRDPFNHTEPFPDYSFDTLVSVLDRERDDKKEVVRAGDTGANTAGS